MTVKQIVWKFFVDVRADIVVDLRDKKMSTGDLNMKVKVGDDSTELTANHYWYYLVHGRRPGKMPPIQSILGWLERKGFRGDGKTSIKSLAFLIARKIGKFGTAIYQGTKPALAIPEILEKRTIQLTKEIDDFYVKEIDKIIKDGLDSIFLPAK